MLRFFFTVILTIIALAILSHFGIEVLDAVKALFAMLGS